MAYYNQERKAVAAPKIKALLKEYGLKGSLSVRNHSTVVLTIKSGSLDFTKNSNEVIGAQHGLPTKTRISVNPYHYNEHFSGQCLEFLTKVFGILNTGNYNNSDIQSDYFDVGWYVDVNVGTWDKPYILTQESRTERS